MPDFTNILSFALIGLGMVLTPGPNMAYLISRSICQGPKAGLISLGGIALGFLMYMFSAALGITALLIAIPFAYDVLRIAGGAYLLYFAWQIVKPGGRSPLQIRDLPPDSSRKLFAMGFVTSILNPKVAVMYLSMLPQFIQPEHGSIFMQSLVLGMTQILVSLSVNSTIVLMAGSIAIGVAGRPVWMVVQRWLMGTVLVGFAIKMMVEVRQ